MLPVPMVWRDRDHRRPFDLQLKELHLEDLPGNPGIYLVFGS